MKSLPALPRSIFLWSLFTSLGTHRKGLKREFEFSRLLQRRSISKVESLGTCLSEFTLATWTSEMMSNAQSTVVLIVGTK
jgi:hypothetical protein